MELRIYSRILIRRWWIVLLAFLSVFVATIAFTSAQAPTYRATATFIVAPKKLSFEDTKSFMTGLDTLSRNLGIAGTYVEVSRSRMIKRESSTALNLSAEERGSLSVDSRLLAGTTVIEITVEGNDPTLAQSFAVMVGDKTTTYMQELYEAYDFKPLDPPSLPRSPARPRKTLNLALGAIFGLALGVGLAFLAEYLQAPLATSAPMAPTVPSPYIGARNMKTLHHPWCSSVKQMKEGNKVGFQTLGEAIAAGYVPCKHCKPQHAATGTDRPSHAHRYSGSDESSRAKQVFPISSSVEP
jgi:succinoglycan biosynthesis transport protein ExoP